MTTPIANGTELVRKAIFAALSPLAGAHDGLPKCYWLLNDQGAPLPFLVYQGDGDDASMLGQAGWVGEFTVRAHGANQADAELLISGVQAAMNGLTAPGGFTITATYLRSPTIPPKDAVWTAAQTYNVELYRA